MSDLERHVVFQGELQLTAWGESMQSGAWVKFWVHPDDLESFKLMRARVGKTPGQRLGAVMVQIDDDEAVVQHGGPAPAEEAIERPKPAPLQDLGRRAVLWCKDWRFQQWVAQQIYARPAADTRASEGECKAFILDTIGATVKYGAQASRKHIDVDPECKRLFLDDIVSPYRDYYQQQGFRE